MEIRKISKSYETILMSIEGPPLRKDLQKTPDRAAKAIIEMLDGYEVDIDSLFTAFDGEGYGQIISLKDITTWSVCEHHILPFCCRVSVAYLPTDKVIGVSKIERLVHAFAHRLQLQERIAKQVADSIMTKLKPEGVAVIIEGVHGCMRCRGVKSQTSKLVNSVMLGEFRDDQPLRLEVLSLLGLK